MEGIPRKKNDHKFNDLEVCWKNSKQMLPSRSFSLCGICTCTHYIAKGS